MKLGDLGPQPGELVVPDVGRPAIRRGLATGREVITPAGERGGGDAEFPGDRFQVFASKELEAGRGLPR